MVPQNNMLFAFLQEFVQRFRTKSPKFFRIWQWITAVGAALTGLPDLLVWLGVTLPPTLLTLENKFIGALSTGMFVMSALTTQSKVASVTSDGIPLKETDPSKLPFTSQAEVKKAQVDMVPNSTKTLEEVKQ